MDIFKGDRVFVYEHKNRKNIKDFSDLIEVEVESVVDNINNIIVSGCVLNEGRYTYDDQGNKNTTVGIVVYKKDGDILLKGNKKYYISFERTGKTFKKSLKDYCGQDIFKLFACFRLDEHVSVKLRISDICFDSVEEMERFTELISIKYPRMYEEKITISINNQEYIFNDYEVHVNGKLVTKDAKARLFRYACKYKNPIKEEVYDFFKVFSMKFDCYEIRRA